MVDEAERVLLRILLLPERIRRDDLLHELRNKLQWRLSRLVRPFHELDVSAQQTVLVRIQVGGLHALTKAGVRVVC